MNRGTKGGIKVTFIYHHNHSIAAKSHHTTTGIRTISSNMSSLSSRRSCLFRISLLIFFLAANGAANKENIRSTETLRNLELPSVESESNQDVSKNRYRAMQRELNNNHNRRKSQYYYEYLDNDAQTNTTTSLLDVWLCLACALGWSIWLISAMQPPQQLVFEQRETAKAMGHVLQVSLGEDTLGTGIPVYYAVIDFVVQGDTDDEHIQVRKIFSSKKLIEEGFANVQVVYLKDDPTTAILLDDLHDQKEERDSESSPSTTMNAALYFVSLLLIGFSFFGGIRMAGRLEYPLYGWISLAIGFLLLYPAAKLLYRLVTHLYSLAGPITDRPGIIVHGKRLYWKNQCHDTLNPLEILGVDTRSSRHKSNRTMELSDLQIPNIARNTRERAGIDELATPKMFPNAGCGFGNFNVHLPTGRPRTSSSVSSISASASQNSEKNSVIVRSDTSILEKYELHVSATEQNGKK